MTTVEGAETFTAAFDRLLKLKQQSTLQNDTLRELQDEAILLQQKYQHGLELFQPPPTLQPPEERPAPLVSSSSSESKSLLPSHRKSKTSRRSKKKRGISVDRSQSTTSRTKSRRSRRRSADTGARKRKRSRASRKSREKSREPKTSLKREKSREPSSIVNLKLSRKSSDPLGTPKLSCEIPKPAQDNGLDLQLERGNNVIVRFGKYRGSEGTLYRKSSAYEGFRFWHVLMNDGIDVKLPEAALVLAAGSVSPETASYQPPVTASQISNDVESDPDTTSSSDVAPMPSFTTAPTPTTNAPTLLELKTQLTLDRITWRVGERIYVPKFSEKGRITAILPDGTLTVFLGDTRVVTLQKSEVIARGYGAKNGEVKSTLSKGPSLPRLRNGTQIPQVIRGWDDLDKFTASHRLAVIVFRMRLGRSKQLEPAIKAIAKKYGERIHFAEVDYNRSRELSNHFNIVKTPTFLFFHNGKFHRSLQSRGEGGERAGARQRLQVDAPSLLHHRSKSTDGHRSRRHGRSSDRRGRRREGTAMRDYGSRSRHSSNGDRGYYKRSDSPEADFSEFSRGRVTHIHSDSQFDRLVRGRRSAVIKFTATWCGPCQMIAPHFEALARQYDGHIKFGEVDVDECRNIMEQERVAAMPTFIFYQGGRRIDQVVGASEEALTAAIARFSSDSD